MKLLNCTTFIYLLTVFATTTWANSSNDKTYILEKSIDVLPRARNFRVSQVIPASRGSQHTVLRLVAEKNPSWWPRGVAVEIVSINGREQRPPKVVYVAKYWFDRATREGEVAQVPDPVQIQEQIISTLTPVLPACEVEVHEPTPPEPVLVQEPRRPAQTDTYSVLLNLVQSSTSERDCHNKLNRWYRENSMWKDLTRKERASIIVAKANDIDLRIKIDGLVDTCSRGTGLNSEADKLEMQSYFTTHYDKRAQKKFNFENASDLCQNYADHKGVSIRNQRVLKKSVYDPQSVHPELDSSLAICIIQREVSVSDFDPHTLNYTFCQESGRRGSPRSTAHGMAQFTRTTFLSLRENGLLPLSSIPNSTNDRTNRTYFQEMSTDPDMQIESILVYLNYLMKANASTRIRRMHDEVYSDAFEDWEKAVISYDQDRASAYIKGVHRCRSCIQNAGDDLMAQATCLAGE